MTVPSERLMVETKKGKEYIVRGLHETGPVVLINRTMKRQLQYHDIKTWFVGEPPFREEF